MFQSKFSKTDLKNEKCPEKNLYYLKKKNSLVSFFFKTADISSQLLKADLLSESIVFQVVSQI